MSAELADAALYEERPGLTVVSRNPADRCERCAAAPGKHGLWGFHATFGSVALRADVARWLCPDCVSDPKRPGSGASVFGHGRRR